MYTEEKVKGILFVCVDYIVIICGGQRTSCGVTSPSDILVFEFELSSRGLYMLVPLFGASDENILNESSQPGESCTRVQWDLLVKTGPRGFGLAQL